MKLLLIAYFTPPIQNPESILVKRMLFGTSRIGLKWDLISVMSSLSHSPKDEKLADDFPPSGVTLKRVPTAEYLLSPLYAISHRRRFEPDTRRGWAPFAAMEGNRLLCGGGYDAFVTWAQPYSDHLIGISLKKKHPSVPWIAYLGDPWAANPYLPFISEKMKRWEKETLMMSNALIVNTSSVRRDFMNRYGDSVGDKIYVIPHPYDNSWLDAGKSCVISARPPGAPIVLTYAGALYGKRSPETMFSAIELAMSALEGAVEVRFIGGMPKEWEDRGRRLEPVVRILGRKPYDETLSLLLQSDMLLLIDAPVAESMFLPSKLVDYLALRKPILALTPEEGASGDILRGLDGAYYFDNADMEGLGEFLSSLAKTRCSSRIEPPDDFMPDTVGRKWLDAINSAILAGGEKIAASSDLL